MAKKSGLDYPYIRAHGRICGSHAYYVEDMLKLARESNAPPDAWAVRGSPSDKPLNWHTLDKTEKTNPDHAARLRKFAGEVPA